MRWLPALMLSVLVLSGCTAEPEDGADTQTATVSASPTPTASTSATTAAAPPTITDLAANVTGLDVAFTFTGRAGKGATWTLAFGDGNETNGTAVTQAIQPVDDANTTLNGTVEHAFAAAGVYNATLTLRDAAGSANRTIVVNVTGGAASAAVVLLSETTASGSLPVEGLTGTLAFDVPAGATLVEVTYVSDHVGLFTALATVSDPAGERISSSDACGFGDSGAATNTCVMTIDADVVAGAWDATVTWQVGQATEDYTLTARVFGVAA